MKKFYTVFLLLIISAFAAVYFFKIGWYPLAIADSNLIWGWQLDKEAQSAMAYYSQTIKTYNIPGVDDEEIMLMEDDLKRASLERIIDKIIISKSLKSLEGDGAEDLVNDKIDKYLENNKLESAASALFNLSFKDFIEIILVPQAEKELVEEKIKAEKRDFNNWLRIQRNQTKVYLFLKGSKWTPDGLMRD